MLVTHDVEEAFLLADHIAVLAEGELVQFGTSGEIRANPASEFVKSFFGIET